MTVLGILAFTLTAVVQGGFFAKTYVPASLLLLVGLIWQLGRKRRPDIKMGILWFLLAVIYAATSLYHGLPVSEWDDVAYFLGVGVMYCYFSALTKEERLKLQQALISIGLLECILGILGYIGIPMEGMIVNMRFMGTFQYANATALFLGILLILQTDIKSGWQKNQLGIRILFTIFLQLTISFGGILCYFVGVVYLGRRNRDLLFRSLAEFVWSGFFAASIFAAKFYAGDYPVITHVLLFLLVLSCCFYSRHGDEVMNFLRRQRIRWGMGMLLCLEGLVGIFRFGFRAEATGWERILQMKDGMALICQNWQLGVGPGRLLDELQKKGVSYKTTLIHNSYIQIGIEAGIFAAGLFLLILVLWWLRVRRLPDRKVPHWKIAIMGMAMLHCAIDISFFFWTIAGIVMFCVMGVEDNSNISGV